jgi:hypothetical protein
MALITLPEINGIAGAVADTEELSYFNQSSQAQEWAVELMKLPDVSSERETEHHIFLKRTRVKKIVWLFEGIRLTYNRDFQKDITAPNWNDCKRIFKVENI